MYTARTKLDPPWCDWLAGSICFVVRFRRSILSRGIRSLFILYGKLYRECHCPTEQNVLCGAGVGGEEEGRGERVAGSC